MAATLKAYKGMGMEGSVARWYDRTTRTEMPEFRDLAARIAALVPPAAQVLEIAPGPGFLSIELARRGLNVRAVDISKTFIDIVRRNAAADNVTVDIQQGNASALPLPDASVDFVVCRSAFKNFTQPIKAMAEMRRVLRPGGTALLIDMRRDSSLAEIKACVQSLGGNWFHRRLNLFIFRRILLKRAYPLDAIRRMAAEAGWTDLHITVASIGFEAWTTK